MAIQGYNVMWMQKGRSLLYIHVEKDDNTLGKVITSRECKKVVA